MPAAKKFFSIVFLLLFYLSLVVYLLCCISSYVPPLSFSPSGILSVMFPFVFLFVLMYCIAFYFFKRKRALIILTVVILAGLKNVLTILAFGTTDWQMQPQADALRIMTWNVSRFSSADRIMGANLVLQNKILAQIQYYHPDVLCMQEYKDVQATATNTSITNTMSAMGYIFSVVSNDTIAVKEYGFVITGTAIFSKIPITDSGRISLQQSKPENMAYADVLFNNRKFRIYSCHLLSFSLYRDDLLKGVPEKDINRLAYRHKSKTWQRMRTIGPEHDREAAIIHDNIIKSPYPAIFCGDINEVPASYIYNTIRDGLQDAFIEKGSGLGRTFFKLSPTLRIDVCLPAKNFNVLQYTSPQLMLSDHFPVICDLAWAKK